MSASYKLQRSPVARARRRCQRAYTVVEVMMAIAVLGVGTSGIIAMEKATALANRDSRNLLVANEIARTWMERLRTDALLWTLPSQASPSGASNLSSTSWLVNVDGGNTWFRPTDTARGAAAADAFGNDLPSTATNFVSDSAFCANVRLTWLYGPASSDPPPYLIRAEVRVFWLRDGGGGIVTTGGSLCATSMNAGAVDSALQNYHFVYITSAIAQNI